MRIAPSALFLCALCASPALAEPVPAGTDAILTLGGGGRFSPDWDGAKSYTLSPMPILGWKFLRSPLTGEPSSDIGFGIRPSFRYLDAREFKAGSPLFGVAKVDRAFELGLAVDYTDTWFRAFVEARQGFGGHDGQLVELGVDAIAHPLPQLTLSVGPRVSFASAAYMRTYFGVSAADAAAAGLTPYRVDGGYRGAGLGGTATWDIDQNWFVRADAGWTHLSDAAAKSPIVRAAGERDQFTIGLGVARRFAIGWH